MLNIEAIPQLSQPCRDEDKKETNYFPEEQDTLRFITCGSVDDGKSTLIGRLLWDSEQLTEDQKEDLKEESKKQGSQGGNIDYALLVDGLSAEREQGITIDVSYRFFATPQRKFIVADAPGHEQYIGNMVTGASTAEVAILLVDAQSGIQQQTRRHAYLASIVGIKNIVLAVNKMDLARYSEKAYLAICDDFIKFSETLGFHTICIPLSALNGDNVCQHSDHMPWHKGPTLLGYLKKVNPTTAEPPFFAFPVQWVNRPTSSFRGYCGTIACGSIKTGDHVRVTSSGQTARLKEIVTFDGKLQSASAHQAITLCLDSNIDISRGDILTKSCEPLEVSQQFEATLIWLHQDKGYMGRTYEIKLATQNGSATITRIKFRRNISTLHEEPCQKISFNEVATCNLSINKDIGFSPFTQSKVLGSFILIDRFSHATVAAGVINHSLGRGKNVYPQPLSIDRSKRETLSGHKGKVIWFTGLPGSGKSTLANALERELYARGKRTYILDGDNIRQGLTKDLGFTDADRIENIRRVAEVARLMLDAGMIVIVALVSPFRQERAMAKSLIGAANFMEVFVDTPFDVCRQRDPKGLYRKAEKGKVKNMTGISSDYEKPIEPDFILKDKETRIEDQTQRILEAFFNPY